MPAKRGRWAIRTLHDPVRATAAADVGNLRGYEGGNGGLLRSLAALSDAQLWRFRGRVYHPPTDFINAMLSFDYCCCCSTTSLLRSTASAWAAIGFFHVVDYGRPSLALDWRRSSGP